jgi:hypothetical protein
MDDSVAYNLDAWVAKREAFEALNAPYILLPQGFGLTTQMPEFDDSFQHPIAWLYISFFGGCGEQESAIFIAGEKVSFGPSYDAVGEALARLGVVRTDDKDEFDVLGFGKNRDNDAITESDIFAFESDDFGF